MNLNANRAAVTRASLEQLGLAFGGLIADGFLIVAAEKNDWWMISADHY